MFLSVYNHLFIYAATYVHMHLFASLLVRSPNRIKLEKDSTFFIQLLLALDRAKQFLSLVLFLGH